MGLRPVRRSVLTAFVCLVGCGRIAFAQTSPPADSLVSQLFNIVSIGAAGIGGDELPGSLTSSIASQLSSYPVGTSSGGFTYLFDPTLGVAGRSTRSFGPSFAERALTIGHRKVSTGFNFQRTKLDRFEDHDLRALPIYDLGVSSEYLGLDLTSDTAAFMVQAGVLPRLDVGVVVPFVRVRMDVAVERRAGIRRVFRYAADGSASGIGDVVLKAKYNFFKRGNGGLAAAVDLRLPTGDEQNLLGSGAKRVKVLGVGSAEVGAFAPHLNVGFTTESSGRCGDGGDLSSVIQCYLGRQEQEFNFSGGVDVIASRRLTILADVIGRTMGEQRRYGYFLGDNTSLDYQVSRLTMVLGSTGVKLNFRGSCLIIAGALFPLTQVGLYSRFAPSVGFDCAL